MIPKWEQLSDALNRVMAAGGQPKGEVQRDICRAISEGAVRILGKLGIQILRRSTAWDTALESDAFQIPTTIEPDDFDWENSRPLKPWLVKRGAFAVPGHWELESIKLDRADVTNALCVAENSAAPTQLAKKVAAHRSQPTRKRAEDIIKELYPEGVPDPTMLPNALLCRHVGEKLKSAALPGVSDDTILRAAGRRRK